MDEKKTDAPKEKDREASSTTTVPADPVADIVTTQHTLPIARPDPPYTATPGPTRPRQAVHQHGRDPGRAEEPRRGVEHHVLGGAAPRGCDGDIDKVGGRGGQQRRDQHSEDDREPRQRE
mgnify:CR=1 FL=1